MNEEKNFSSIPGSYTPSDYTKARFSANCGDACLPIPSLDDCIDADNKKETD